jgi:hypothetical protein
MDASVDRGLAVDEGPWKRNLIVVLFGSFTTIVAMTLLLPFLPIYVEQLGVTDHAAIVQWSGAAYGAAWPHTSRNSRKGTMAERVHQLGRGDDMMTGLSRAMDRPRWMRRAGWGISGLMIAFMLFDAVSKLILEHHVVEATAQIGFPFDMIRPLGVICLACTILYAIPRTSVLGAILLTGAAPSPVKCE